MSADVTIAAGDALAPLHARRALRPHPHLVIRGIAKLDEAYPGVGFGADPAMVK
jgi:hypothetical protein